MQFVQMSEADALKCRSVDINPRVTTEAQPRLVQTLPPHVNANKFNAPRTLSSNPELPFAKNRCHRTTVGSQCGPVVELPSSYYSIQVRPLNPSGIIILKQAKSLSSGDILSRQSSFYVFAGLAGIN